MVESLAAGGGSEVQRVKEDAQKQVRQVEDLLNKRIFHLEEASLGAPRSMDPCRWLIVEWAEFRSFRDLQTCRRHEGLTVQPCPSP